MAIFRVNLGQPVAFLITTVYLFTEVHPLGTGQRFSHSPYGTSLCLVILNSNHKLLE